MTGPLTYAAIGANAPLDPLWDAVKSALATTRMRQVLSGTGAITANIPIYAPTDDIPQKEGSSDAPWGRIVIQAVQTMWPSTTRPGETRRVPFQLQVEFNNFRAPGYKVAQAIAAAHTEALRALANLVPVAAGLVVVMPIYQYSPPTDVAWDEGTGTWWSSAVYRTEVYEGAGVVNVALRSLSIATPPTVTYLPLQLALTMIDVNGASVNPLTRAVSWGSLDPTIARVSPTGVVTSIATGVTEIVAVSEGLEARATIYVQPIVYAVSVTPNPMTLGHGATQQLTVTAIDSIGTVLTGRTTTFVSLDPTIATVSPTGLVTAVGGGSVTIVVTVDGVSAPAVIVNALAAVASVTVSPSSLTMIVGVTQQASSTQRDAGGNVLTGRVVTWASSNTGVFTVSSSGIVTPVAAGSATLTATSEGVSSAGVAVAITDPVYAVAVAPSAPTIAGGIGGTQQLTVTLTNVIGSILTGRVVTWSSSNTSVMTVNSSGLVTAAAANGTATITATSEGKSASSSVTVTSLAATFKYTVGDTNPFTNYGARNSAAYQFNSDGTIGSVAVNIMRDAHYFGTTRTLLLEPLSTNRMGYSRDITSGFAGPATRTLGAGDPFGGSSLGNNADVSATVTQYSYSTQSAFIASGNQTVSIIAKRGATPGRGEIIIYSETQGIVHGGVAVDWSSAGPPVLSTPPGYTNTVNYYVKQIGSGAFYLIVFSGSGLVNTETNRIYWFPARYSASGLASATDDPTQTGDIYVAHVEIDNGLIPHSPIVNTGASQNTTQADNYGLNVPGGAGQVGTLYEKYIDLATGNLVEQVSAYTTSATYFPQTGRAWITWKFALGTQTLATMQGL